MVPAIKRKPRLAAAVECHLFETLAVSTVRANHLTGRVLVLWSRAEVEVEVEGVIREALTAGPMPEARFELRRVQKSPQEKRLAVNVALGGINLLAAGVTLFGGAFSTPLWVITTATTVVTSFDFVRELWQVGTGQVRPKVGALVGLATISNLLVKESTVSLAVVTYLNLVELLELRAVRRARELMRPAREIQARLVSEVEEVSVSADSLREGQLLDARMDESKKAKSRHISFEEKITAVAVPGAVASAGLVLLVTREPQRALNALLLASPYSAALAAPTALSLSVGLAAHQGIVIRRHNCLEVLARIDTVCFEKTGTLANDRPTLRSVEVCDSSLSEEEALPVGATLRPEAAEVVTAIRQLGIDVILLSGDEEAQVARSAQELEIDRWYANAGPMDKVLVISELQQSGQCVLMVGSGASDAPALASADVGIAIRAREGETASEAADIAVASRHLYDLPRLLESSHASSRVIRQNYGIALGISQVTGVMILFGWLSETAATAWYNASTCLVALNSGRLLANPADQHHLQSSSSDQQ